MSDASLVIRYDAQKKSAGIAYLLWFIGPLGAHRFYLGKWLSGLLLLSLTLLAIVLTFTGFFSLESLGLAIACWILIGVWELLDLILIPGAVRNYNTRVVTRLEKAVGHA